MSEASSRHQCRRCGGELERGYAQLHGTLAGFLLYGLSYTHLYATPDQDSSDAGVFMQWKERCVAYHCLGCGTLVITPHEWV
jgi:hypothetical protein